MTIGSREGSRCMHMHRNKICLACACQLLVLLMMSIPTTVEFLFQPVPQSRRSSPTSEQHHELVFVLPSPDAFQSHINAEFGQVTGLLANKYGWQRQELASLKQAEMPRGADTRASSLAQSMLNKRRTANTKTIFVLKFHWDYDALVALGKGLREKAVETMAYVDDLHWYNAAGREVQQRALSMTSTIFSTYSYRLEILYPHVVLIRKGTQQRPSCSWAPHATTPMFFMSLTTSASLASQVLVSGATHKEWYPFRHVIARDIVTQSLDSSRFALVDHPGYYEHGRSSTPVLPSTPTASSSIITGRAFAHRLNKHAACIIDGLHLSYVVAKVFEIPASGCLLLAPIDLVPWLARLGFFETVHFLAYRDLKALDALVAWTTDAANAAVIDKIRRRAQQLVWRRHVVAHRAALLNGLVVRRSKGEGK